MAEAARFSIRRLPGFTAIAVLCFVLLYAPVVTLIVFSFNAGTSIAIWEGFSWRWYEAAWNNRDIQEVSLRSLFIASIAATIATVTATMAALATTRKKAFAGMTAVYALINAPLIVPEIVTAVALLITFASIKVATGYAGLGYLLAAHAAFCIPFAYLPVRARLESMDLTLELAASDLYATPWKTFLRVTFPLLWPGILAGFMLAFVISLDDVVITEFVKSAGQDTLPTYMLGQLRRQLTPEINAISTAFFMLSVVIVTLFFFLNRRKS
ncbi:MAG: ABC transporter permease [Aestuariivirga sp.]|uniref:ABC transporter permease n=1 Tax=Aestuariivirga sp. TaxID=2650926 RepID=UPI0038D15900